MNKSTTRNQVILAALLHDIGKFWQRADTRLRESQNIENKNEEHLKTIVPFKTIGQSERPGYQHAIWTYQFFTNHKKIFQELGLWSEEQDSLLNMAANHHRPSPQSDLQKLIQRADWWSSGIDRRNMTSEEYDSIDQRKDLVDYGTRLAFKKTPLHSIFDDIHASEIKGRINTHTFPLTPLSLEDKRIFKPAEENQSNVRDLTSEYNSLWQQFNKEFKDLPRLSPSGFIASLVSLLKKYTWCIPSSTIDMPNVSLFEHLKSTAAIASCLFEYGYEKNGAFSIDHVIDEEIHPILICHLDLSGIQKFIYDIASSKAFVSLKGRSYYLHLLMESLIKSILSHQDIQQSPVNIIYASGGGAYLLLPNIERVKKALTSIIHKFNTNCWNEHRGTIFAAAGWVPFRYVFQKNKTGQKGIIQSPHSFSNGKDVENLGDLWRAAAEMSSQQKRQKFVNVTLDDFESAFGKNGIGIEAGGELELCEVTGEPLKEEEKEIIGRGEQILRVHKKVKEQVDLGRKLKDADTLLHFYNLHDEINDTFGYIKPSGMKSSFFLIADTDRNKEWLKKYPKDVAVMNATDFLNPDRLPIGEIESITFQFYGGNKQPTIQKNKGDSFDSKRNKTLEELCYFTENSEDYTKLGILRMDVDNLGKIFIRGLDPDNRTFASLATLSFLLDLFFSGYINTLRERDRYKDSVSILYSGGDDLFAVGRWDSLLDFAWEVRQAFSDFVGRQDLSISGGLIIVDRKYPIYKAADLAGEAEKMAKEFNNGEKNALNVFGESISFQNEFEIVHTLKEKFVNLITLKGSEGKTMSRGILHQLQRYKSLKNHNSVRMSQGRDIDLSYKWHAIYYLKRFEENTKNEKISDFVNELQSNLLYSPDIGSDRYLDLVAVAARWTEYSLQIISPE